MAENTEGIIKETQQPTQTEEITQDTLKRKGGTASVSQYQRTLIVGGKEFVTISQDVEITNPNSPKRKFESQQISIFEDKNILTTISQRHNDSGASNVVAYLQKTEAEKGKTKLEFCLGADYINNIINNSDYPNKQNLIDILGEKDENGFYHLEATDAHISKDLNLDTLNFKTKDNETYGIMFSALGMQLKYANGAIITKPLNLKENGKEAKEGEDYPFDLSMSSICFEKDKPENLVISTEISQEVLDNMQVSALRSRSKTNRKKRQTLYISDETRLEYIPLGIKQEEIGYEQLDFKIENGQTFVYMQRSVEHQNRSKKPCFLKVDGASFVISTKTGEKFLSLALVRGTDNSNVYVPIDKITEKNCEYLANDLLKASFEKSAKSSGDPIENIEIAGRPVYHKNVDQNHIISGYNVASLVRHTEQKAKENPVEEVASTNPTTDDNAGDDDGNGVAIVENIGENESSANSNNSSNTQESSSNNEEKKSEEKVVEEESNENKENNNGNDGKDGKKDENKEEKPKKKWSEWLTNLMSGDTFLGVSVTVMLFGTLFPPLALFGGAMLVGFGAAKSGFISMFEGFSFKKAKLSQKEIQDELDKQKNRQLQKAERQRNRNVSKKDKRLLKDVNEQIDKRNDLVKELRDEKAKVEKEILGKNKELDKDIAQQKELYETILTKVNPEKLDIDKSLLSHELNKLLDNYNGVKQRIADKQNARDGYLKTLQNARDNALTNQQNAIKNKSEAIEKRDKEIAVEREEVYIRAINNFKNEIENNKRYAEQATNKKEEARYKKEAERAETKLKAKQHQLNKFNEYVEKGIDEFTKAWKVADAECDRIINSATAEYNKKEQEYLTFVKSQNQGKKLQDFINEKYEKSIQDNKSVSYEQVYNEVINKNQELKNRIIEKQNERKEYIKNNPNDTTLKELSEEKAYDLIVDENLSKKYEEREDIPPYFDMDKIDIYSKEIIKLKIEQETAKKEYRKGLKPEQDRIKEKYNALISEKNTLNEQAQTNSDEFSKKSNIDSLNTQIELVDKAIENARKERKDFAKKASDGLDDYTLEMNDKKAEIEEKFEDEKEIVDDYFENKNHKKILKQIKNNSNGEKPLREL